jgi:hypothetical protein
MVTAKHAGDTVEFAVVADTIASALIKARREARDIFEWVGLGPAPTVSVRRVR